MLRIERHRRDAFPEDPEDLGGRRPTMRRRRRRSRRAEEPGPRLHVHLGLDGSLHRAVEQPIERLAIDRVGELFVGPSGTGPPRIEQLWIGHAWEVIARHRHGPRGY